MSTGKLYDPRVRAVDQRGMAADGSLRRLARWSSPRQTEWDWSRNCVD